MQHRKNLSINIKEIIEKESIEIHFHPIISIRKKAIIGLEALSIGIVDGKNIPYSILYRLAKEKELVVDFDRLCRRKAMEDFSVFIHHNLQYSDIILFLNIEASIVEKGIAGSDLLLDTVNEFKLDPCKMVIEIAEARVNDTVALKRFVDVYKEQGFIVALDDVGTGYSDLNRLTIVKPDVLKIDTSIVKNVDNEFYKQEVLKSLVNLSKKIGAMVIAEGIETEDEAIMSLDFGVDMLQGFYFMEPMLIKSIFSNELDQKNERIAMRLKEYVLNNLHRENRRRQEYNTIVNKIIFELATLSPDDFDKKLNEMVCIFKNTECIYVLDEKGIQVSNTISNNAIISKQRMAIFQPAPKGTDHTSKNYYYLTLVSPTGMFITEPYISLVSGNLCTTISTAFIDTNNNKYILCIDANC